MTYAVAVVVDGDGRALLVKRPSDGLLPGLWAFPDAPVEDGGEGMDRIWAAAREAAIAAGAEPGASPPAVLDAVRHRFTHLYARYVPVVLRGSGRDGPGARWLGLDDPRGVALPVAQRRIASIAWAHHRAGESRGHADP